jgi:hypothetical protein
VLGNQNPLAGSSNLVGNTLKISWTLSLATCLSTRWFKWTRFSTRIALIHARPNITAFCRDAAAGQALVVNAFLAEFWDANGYPGAITAFHAVAFVVFLSAAAYLGIWVVAFAAAASLAVRATVAFVAAAFGQVAAAGHAAGTPRAAPANI